MNTVETIEYLKDGGSFFGARVVSGTEVIHIENDLVSVNVRQNNRKITIDQFKMQFAGDQFEPVQPVDA